MKTRNHDLLFKAIEKSDQRAVESVLQQANFNPNMTKSICLGGATYKRSILVQALLYAPEWISTLLEQGADPNRLSFYKWTGKKPKRSYLPLELAWGEGHLQGFITLALKTTDDVLSTITPNSRKQLMMQLVKLIRTMSQSEHVDIDFQNIALGKRGVEIIQAATERFNNQIHSLKLIKCHLVGKIDSLNNLLLNQPGLTQLDLSKNSKLSQSTLWQVLNHISKAETVHSVSLSENPLTDLFNSAIEMQLNGRQLPMKLDLSGASLSSHDCDALAGAVGAGKISSLDASSNSLSHNQIVSLLSAYEPFVDVSEDALSPVSMQIDFDGSDLASQRVSRVKTILSQNYAVDSSAYSAHEHDFERPTFAAFMEHMEVASQKEMIEQDIFDSRKALKHAMHVGTDNQVYLVPMTFENGRYQLDLAAIACEEQRKTRQIIELHDQKSHKLVAKAMYSDGQLLIEVNQADINISLDPQTYLKKCFIDNKEGSVVLHSSGQSIDLLEVNATNLLIPTSSEVRAKDLRVRNDGVFRIDGSVDCFGMDVESEQSINNGQFFTQNGCLIKSKEFHNTGFLENYGNMGFTGSAFVNGNNGKIKTWQNAYVQSDTVIESGEHFVHGHHFINGENILVDGELDDASLSMQMSGYIVFQNNANVKTAQYLDVQARMFEQNHAHVETHYDAKRVRAAQKINHELNPTLTGYEKHGVHIAADNVGLNESFLASTGDVTIDAKEYSQNRTNVGVIQQPGIGKVRCNIRANNRCAIQGESSVSSDGRLELYAGDLDLYSSAIKSKEKMQLNADQLAVDADLYSEQDIDIKADRGHYSDASLIESQGKVFISQVNGHHEGQMTGCKVYITSEEELTTTETSNIQSVEEAQLTAKNLTVGGQCVSGGDCTLEGTRKNHLKKEANLYTENTLHVRGGTWILYGKALARNKVDVDCSKQVYTRPESEIICDGAVEVHTKRVIHRGAVTSQDCLIDAKKQKFTTDGVVIAKNKFTQKAGKVIQDGNITALEADLQSKEYLHRGEFIATHTAKAAIEKRFQVEGDFNGGELMQIEAGDLDVSKKVFANTATYLQVQKKINLGEGGCLAANEHVQCAADHIDQHRHSSIKSGGACMVSARAAEIGGAIESKKQATILATDMLSFSKSAKIKTPENQLVLQASKVHHDGSLEAKGVVIHSEKQCHLDKHARLKTDEAVVVLTSELKTDCQFELETDFIVQSKEKVKLTGEGKFHTKKTVSINAPDCEIDVIVKGDEAFSLSGTSEKPRANLEVTKKGKFETDKCGNLYLHDWSCEGGISAGLLLSVDFDGEATVGLTGKIKTIGEMRILGEWLYNQGAVFNRFKGKTNVGYVYKGRVYEEQPAFLEAKNFKLSSSAFYGFENYISHDQAKDQMRLCEDKNLLLTYRHADDGPLYVCGVDLNDEIKVCKIEDIEISENELTYNDLSKLNQNSIIKSAVSKLHPLAPIPRVVFLYKGVVYEKMPIDPDNFTLNIHKVDLAHEQAKELLNQRSEAKQLLLYRNIGDGKFYVCGYDANDTIKTTAIKNVGHLSKKKKKEIIAGAIASLHPVTPIQLGKTRVLLNRPIINGVTSKEAVMERYGEINELTTKSTGLKDTQKTISRFIPSISAPELEIVSPVIFNFLGRLRGARSLSNSSFIDASIFGIRASSRTSVNTILCPGFGTLNVPDPGELMAIIDKMINFDFKNLFSELFDSKSKTVLLEAIKFLFPAEQAAITFVQTLFSVAFNIPTVYQGLKKLYYEPAEILQPRELIPLLLGVKDMVSSMATLYSMHKPALARAKILKEKPTSILSQERDVSLKQNLDRAALFLPIPNFTKDAAFSLKGKGVTISANTTEKSLYAVNYGNHEVSHAYSSTALWQYAGGHYHGNHAAFRGKDMVLDADFDDQDVQIVLSGRLKQLAESTIQDCDLHLETKDFEQEGNIDLLNKVVRMKIHAKHTVEEGAECSIRKDHAPQIPAEESQMTSPEKTNEEIKSDTGETLPEQNLSDKKEADKQTKEEAKNDKLTYQSAETEVRGKLVFEGLDGVKIGGLIGCVGSQYNVESCKGVEHGTYISSGDASFDKSQIKTEHYETTKESHTRVSETQHDVGSAIVGGKNEYKESSLTAQNTLRFEDGSSLTTEDTSFENKNGDIYFGADAVFEGDNRLKTTNDIHTSAVSSMRGDGKVTLESRNINPLGEVSLARATIVSETFQDVNDVIHAKGKFARFRPTKSVGINTCGHHTIETIDDTRDILIEADSLTVTAPTTQKRQAQPQKTGINTQGDVTLITKTGDLNVDADVTGHNTHMQSGRDMNAQGVTIRGLNRVAVLAKGNISLTNKRIPVQGRYDIEMRFIPGQILGGAGEGFDGIGAYVHAENLLNMRASNIGAQGDVYQLGDKGIVVKADQRQYLKKDELKRRWHGGKEVKKEYAIKVGSSAVCSSEGKVVVGSKDGSANLTAVTYTAGKELYHQVKGRIDYREVDAKTTIKEDNKGFLRLTRDRKKGERHEFHGVTNYYNTEFKGTALEGDISGIGASFVGQGKARFSAQQGGINFSGSNFISKDGTDIHAKKDIRLGSATHQENLSSSSIGIKNGLAGLGFQHQTQQARSDVSRFTVFYDEGLTRIHSNEGNVDAFGTYFCGKNGDLEIDAAKRITFGRELLDHSTTQRTISVTPSVLGSNTVQALIDHKGVWTGLTAEEPTLAKIDSLLNSGNTIEGITNVANLSIDLYNAISNIGRDLANDQLGQGLMDRYGLTDGDGNFNPTIHVKVGKTTQRQNQQTLGLGGADKKDIRLKAGEGVNLVNGVDVHANGNATLDTPELKVMAADLHASQSERSRSTTLGFKPSGTFVDVGVSYGSSKSKSTTYINSNLSADGHLNLGKIDRAVLHGGKISAQSVSGHIEHTDVESMQDSTSARSYHVSASSSGQVTASLSESKSKRINEASGFDIREGYDDLTFKKVKSTGGKFVTASKNNFSAKELIARDLDDYEETHGYGVSFNIGELVDRATSDDSSKEKGGSVKPRGKPINTVELTIDRKDYSGRQKTTIHGEEGTNLDIKNLDGAFHTKDSDGYKTEKDSEIHLKIDVPVTDKKSLSVASQNIAIGYRKVRDSYGRIQDRLMGRSEGLEPQVNKPGEIQAEGKEETSKQADEQQNTENEENEKAIDQSKIPDKKQEEYNGKDEEEFTPKDFKLLNVFGGETGAVLRFKNEEDQIAYEDLTRQHEEQKLNGKIDRKTPEALCNLLKRGEIIQPDSPYTRNKEFAEELGKLNAQLMNCFDDDCLETLTKQTIGGLLDSVGATYNFVLDEKLLGYFNTPSEYIDRAYLINQNNHSNYFVMPATFGYDEDSEIVFFSNSEASRESHELEALYLRSSEEKRASDQSFRENIKYHPIFQTDSLGWGIYRGAVSILTTNLILSGSGFLPKNLTKLQKLAFDGAVTFVTTNGTLTDRSIGAGISIGFDAAISMLPFGLSIYGNKFSRAIHEHVIIPGLANYGIESYRGTIENTSTDTSENRSRQDRLEEMFRQQPPPPQDEPRAQARQPEPDNEEPVAPVQTTPPTTTALPHPIWQNPVPEQTDNGSKTPWYTTKNLCVLKR